GLMVEAAERVAASWDRSEGESVIGVTHEMSALAIDIVGRALLSADLGERAAAVISAVSVVQEHLNRRIFNFVPVPERYPTPANRRFRRALALLDDVVFEIIEARRAEGPGSRHDLLATLLEAQDEETGEGLTDLELRDEVMTIFLAGHETTADALA